MRKQKYVYTTNTVLEWANKFESMRTWLKKINGTKAMRALDFFHFSNFVGKNPDELLALKNTYDSLIIEKLLDRFVVEADLPDSQRWRSSIAARSFFRCNYRQLQSEAGKMEYVQKKPQRYLTKKQRLDLYKACFNQRDRALICVATCSAIAAETMTQLRWSHFEENWQRQDIPNISLPSEILKGHGKGKYRGVRQETFVTPETKLELKKYREWLTQRGHEWNDDDFVFLDVKKPFEPLGYQGMSTSVQTISIRAKVPFSIHDGRRIVETAMENVGTPRNWIQKIKGRKVRGEDAPYSKPAVEMLRAKYRQALPDLEFLQSIGEYEAGEELKQRLEKSELESQYLRKEMELMKGKLDFLDRYIGLSDVVKTKADAKRVLDFFEQLRKEKEAEEQREEEKAKAEISEKLKQEK